MSAGVITRSLLGLLLVAGCDRPDVRFPQFVQDHMVVGAILWEVGGILDAAFAGQAPGDVGFDTPCPGGGSLGITGTTSADGAADLALTLDACAIEQAAPASDALSSLTLAGTMTFVLVPGQNGGASREEVQATDLAIDGSVARQGEVRDLQLQCPFVVTVVASSTSLAYMGQLCGRDTTAAVAHTACGM